MKTEKFFIIGLTIAGITILLNRFIYLSDIIYGFLLGIAATCEAMSFVLNSKRRKK